MWWRGVTGAVALAVGALWIGQGVGTVHGSFMTGHQEYTVLGAAVTLAGLAMLGWGFLVGRRRGRGPRPAAQP